MRAIGPVLAQEYIQREMNGRPYYFYAQHGGGHPLLHVLLLVLLLLLVAAAVFFFVRLIVRQRATAAPRLVPAAGPPADALGIARLRYARGEIDRDAFVRMSADLGAALEVAWPAPPVEPPAAPDSSEAPTA